jgi:single-stranded-DNA-specific exonuclease
MTGVIAPRLDWLLPEPIVAPALSGFGAPVATLLARRGITDQPALERFLSASEATLHPIGLMADAEPALDRIEQALAAGDRIAIWGDYDADGMSAVAVWTLALRAIGGEPLRHVPSRWTDGYGLSVAGLSALAEQGVRLVITCDCGVTNVAEVAEARRLGLDVIVTDHHLPGPVLPGAVAVVDPHRTDCTYPDRGLTGAGLSYRLATALLARQGRRAADLAAVAAIGTVADLAPMTGESRTVVMLGLRQLAATARPGLRALLARSVADPAAPTARELAYAIAPRINAAGRIAEAELAMALLVSEEPREAERLADELEAVHHRRREMTTVALADARRRAAAHADAGGSGPLVIRNDAWEAGLIGLVAGRLADEMARPVAVVSAVEDELRGSVRATADFHVGAALEACAVHLTKRGGHAAAGGFSLDPAAWDAFEGAFTALPRPFGIADGTRPPDGGALRVDLVLPAAHLGWPLAEELARLEPYGPGNEEPVLAVTGLVVGEARRVGSDDAHLAFRMRRGFETFDAVCFGVPQERPVPGPGAPIDLVGTLERDRFGGLDRLRLRVMDYADASASPLAERRRIHARPALAASA